MDIEGGEYNALLGARAIITEFKLKMAISVYHYCDDLVRIPMQTRVMAPEHELYLRHHAPVSVDTGVYAKQNNSNT